jgi:putative phosphoesterase
VRLAVTSDIHIDTAPANRRLVPELIRAIAESEPDVFILCGDLSPFPNDLSSVLEEFRTKLDSCRRIFVSGNHDIWLNDEFCLGTSEKKQALISDICSKTGFHHLDREPLVFRDVGFCGTIGWYDYTFRDARYGFSTEDYRMKRRGDTVWMDLHLARWEKSDIETAHLFEESLRSQIEAVRSVSETIVVATHHVPFRACVKYKGRLPWDYFSSFMGSEGLGRICLDEKKVSRVFFGHTHFPIEARIGPITAVCSPVGYLFEAPPDPYAYAKSRIAVVEI